MALARRLDRAVSKSAMPDVEHGSPSGTAKNIGAWGDHKFQMAVTTVGMVASAAVLADMAFFEGEDREWTAMHVAILLAIVLGTQKVGVTRRWS